MTSNETIAAAVSQLARSDEGLSSLRLLLVWFEQDGLRLDARNERAVLQLIDAAWSGSAGTVLDALQPFRAR